MSDIIQPGDDAEPIPDDIKRQQIQEARIQMGKAQKFAKEFVKRMQKEFQPDTAAFLSLVATTSCDMLAEALVAMDEHKLQPLKAAIPMFTKRLTLQIQAEMDKNDEGRITIARDLPPSKN